VDLVLKILLEVICNAILNSLYKVLQQEGSIMKTGASGVAVIGAAHEVKYPQREVQQLCNIISGGKKL
jgi:hypothetical protein